MAVRHVSFLDLTPLYARVDAHPGNNILKPQIRGLEFKMLPQYKKMPPQSQEDFFMERVAFLRQTASTTASQVRSSSWCQCSCLPSLVMDGARKKCLVGMRL